VTTFDNELLELMKEMRIEVSDIKNTTNRIDNKVEDSIRYLRSELNKLQTIEGCKNKQECCQVREINNFKIKKIALISSAIGAIATIIVTIAMTLINKFL